MSLRNLLTTCSYCIMGAFHDVLKVSGSLDTLSELEPPHHAWAPEGQCACDPLDSQQKLEGQLPTAGVSWSLPRARCVLMPSTCRWRQPSTSLRAALPMSVPLRCLSAEGIMTVLSLMQGPCSLLFGTRTAIVPLWGYLLQNPPGC